MSETTETRENSTVSPAPSMIPGSKDAEEEATLPLTPLALALSSAAQNASALTESGGTRTIAHFSDAATELSALTTAAGVFDRGARVRIRITGQDRVRWLNGMVTNTVKALATSSHNYTFVLNAQGRIQGDATVFAFPDHLIFETDCSQSPHLLAHFEHFIIMDDVELAPVAGQTTLGLAGPQAEAVLAAIGLPVPPANSFIAQDWRNLPICLVSEASAFVPRFSLWVAEAAATQLWEALLAAGAVPAGAVAVDALRVLEGMPLYGADISEKTLAQETGQTRALNFTKGCYLGQEIVERVRSRANVHRGIRQFALHGDPARPGTAILADGAPVGEVTSVAHISLPQFTGQLALATVRTEVLDRGATLTYPGGTAEWLHASPLAGAGADTGDI